MCSSDLGVGSERDVVVFGASVAAGRRSAATALIPATAATALLVAATATAATLLVAATTAAVAARTAKPASTENFTAPNVSLLQVPPARISTFLPPRLEEFVNAAATLQPSGPLGAGPLFQLFQPSGSDRPTIDTESPRRRHRGETAQRYTVN